MAQAFSSKQMWDDKFGRIDHHEFDDIKIEGVGRDAEVVVNAQGGKQSKTPMAMHLVDPEYLESWADNKAEELTYRDKEGCRCIDGDEDCEKFDCFNAISNIASFMQLGEKMFLDNAISDLEMDDVQALTRIAKVLQIGASRYAANNWRLIPQEEHINHALIHIIAHIAGDRQDEHLDHALCRLMMAYATERSEGFEYGAYVKKAGK